MPEVGVGVVPILPDFSRFGRDLQRGIEPHLQRAGKSLNVAVHADTSGLSAELQRELGPVAERTSGLLVPVGADTSKFETDLDAGVRPALDPVDVPVTADASGLPGAVRPHARRAAQEVESALSDATKKGLGRSFAKAADEAAEKLSRIGSTMSRNVTLPVVAGFTLMTKAASDLEEQTNKTTVVFGDSADEIVDFTRTASKSLGQSRRAALEFAGTFGNLFRAVGLTSEKSAEMSKSLLTLTADLASFNDARPDEVFEALRAGLVGESEPLRRFGVNLNEARLKAEALNLKIYDGKGVLDAAAKAQAAYSIILKDTALAQGDFARTSDGLANQTRIVRAQLEDTAAELGQKLIPFALKAADAALTLANAFSGLDDSTQALLLIGTGLLATLGPVVSVVGNITKAVGGLSKAVVFLATSTATAKVALSGLGLAAGGIAVGFVAYKVAVDAINSANEKFNAGTAVAVNNAALFDGATKKTAQGLKAQAVAAYTAGVALNTHTDVQRGAAVVGKTMGDEQEKARRVLAELAETTDVSRERIVELANSMGVNLGAMSEEARERLAGAIAQISRGVNPTERLAAVQETLASTTATAAEAYDAFKEAIDAALGTVLDEQEAAIALAEKIDDLGESLASGAEEVADAQDRVREAQERLNAARRAAVGDTEAVARAELKLAEAHFSVEEAERKLNELRAGPDPSSVRRAELAMSEANLDVASAQRKLDEARKRRTSRPEDVEALARAEQDLAEAMFDASEAQRKLDEARAGPGPEEIKRAELELADATLKVSGAQKDLNEAQRPQDTAEVAAATRELAQAQRDLTTALSNAESKVGVATQRQRELNASLIEVVRAAKDEVDALTLSGKISTDSAAQKAALIQRLDEVKRKYPELSGPIDAYIAKINEIPAAPVTTPQVDTTVAEAKLKALREQFAAFQSDPLAQGPSLLGPVGAGGGAGGVQRRHSGGLVEGHGYEVPIMAQPKEYVIQRSAVKALGTDYLDRLNRFHTGGLVPDAARTAPALPASQIERIPSSLPEPVVTASGGVTVEMGGVVLNGVKDGDQALTRLPVALGSELFLAGY